MQKEYNGAEAERKPFSPVPVSAVISVLIVISVFVKAHNINKQAEETWYSEPAVQASDAGMSGTETQMSDAGQSESYSDPFADPAWWESEDGSYDESVSESFDESGYLSDSESGTDVSDGSGSSAEPVYAEESGTIMITGVDEDVSISDFDWYFRDELPMGVAPYSELWGLGGMWKSMIYVQGVSDDRSVFKIVLSDTDVQYMGYKLTLLFNVKSRYEAPVDDPDNRTLVSQDQGAVITMNGDWNEEETSMDIVSDSSELGCEINKFMTKDGYDYAFGVVYNGTVPIGDVIMIRKAVQNGQ